MRGVPRAHTPAYVGASPRALLPVKEEPLETRTGKTGWIVGTPPFEGGVWRYATTHIGGDPPKHGGHLSLSRPTPWRAQHWA